GDDQLVAPALEQVQHSASCRFDTRRLGRQHLFDAIWQEPAVYRCHFAITSRYGKPSQADETELQPGPAIGRVRLYVFEPWRQGHAPFQGISMASHAGS